MIVNEQAVNSDEMLKATALVYFKEALQKEEYESCKELVDLAKKLGAQQSEISEVIAGYVRKFKAAGQNEANRNKSRLRLSKEGK